MLFLSSADYSKLTFSKKSFRNTVSECQTVLNPDQDRLNVGPYLGPSCLKRLSTDNKIAASKKIVKVKTIKVPGAVDILNLCIDFDKHNF